MSGLPGYDCGGTLRLPSPLAELADARLDEHHVRLLLKRDDLIHPELPGNKWRKLSHNLAAAREQGHTTLLTFGGAYSNHIRAVAAAGRMLGFSTIGVIRGERVEPLNWSLSYATAQGMELTYLDRETYRHKHEPQVLDALRVKLGDVYVLPEGGSNALAVRGCAKLPQEIDTGFDLICCPVGSGGTLAGIAAGLAPGQRALGFSALKGARSLNAEVAKLQRDTFGATSGNWTINHDFHCGGFAKRTPELDGFIADFHQRHGVDLDWVYVAKMLYGVVTLAEQGEFNPGTTIAAVITGPAEPVWPHLVRCLARRRPNPPGRPGPGRTRDSPMRTHPVPAHRRSHRHPLGSGADLLQLPYWLHRDSSVSRHEATTLMVVDRSPVGSAVLSELPVWTNVRSPYRRSTHPRASAAGLPSFPGCG